MIASPNVAISIESLSDEIDVVRIAGELDALALPRLFTVLGNLDSPEQVIIDVRRVHFVSRTGLSALADLASLSSLTGASVAIIAPANLREALAARENAPLSCSSLRAACSLLAARPARPALRLVSSAS
ncbi:STAS domain-containing protein [Lolliginicoccus suaedae]|uniref:STAS domain-containing protein n=1 Tax=Lolliginicoccus suaedae TaxID=2605429 RepID=UPI0011EDF2BB|nr:STAS domain-containing protein [Lolliginicoccus suaedae]